MVELKSFPVFYPPDGLYYIFSKDFGHFWRQRGSEPDGGLIDCGMLGPVKEGETPDNRMVSSIFFMATIEALTCFSAVETYLNKSSDCQARTSCNTAMRSIAS